MKVHLIKKLTIEEYVGNHRNGKEAFRNWLTGVKHADWEKPEDIKSTFGSADFLGKGTKRVVFDIGGNNYRMICKYEFGNTKVWLFVCWIGTHTEYDELCDDSKQYTINIY